MKMIYILLPLTIILLTGCASKNIIITPNTNTATGGGDTYITNQYYNITTNYTYNITNDNYITNNITINYTNNITNENTYYTTNNITNNLTINYTYNITNNYTTNMTMEQIQALGFQNSSNQILNNYNQWGCQRNNTYCDGLQGNTARTVATAYTASVLRCFPYITGKGYQIDQLGAIVATANASALIKIALYADNGQAYPGNLLINTSSINVSTTGYKNQAITPYQLQNNTLYWLCSAWNGAGTLLRVNVAPVNDYPPTLGLSSSTAGNIGYTVAYTYTNALPNPYTAGATYVTAIYPTSYMRVIIN